MPKMTAGTSRRHPSGAYLGLACLCLASPGLDRRSCTQADALWMQHQQPPHSPRGRGMQPATALPSSSWGVLHLLTHQGRDNSTTKRWFCSAYVHCSCQHLLPQNGGLSPSPAELSAPVTTSEGWPAGGQAGIVREGPDGSSGVRAQQRTATGAVSMWPQAEHALPPNLPSLRLTRKVLIKAQHARHQELQARVVGTVNWRRSRGSSR